MAKLADEIRQLSDDFARSIRILAEDFTDGVLSAIRASSLEDLLAQASPRRKSARPGKTNDVSHLRTEFKRRPASLVQGHANLVIRYVKDHPGCSGEAARKELGLPRGKWNTTVKKAIATGQLRKEGQKRATRYFVPSQPYVPRGREANDA